MTEKNCRSSQSHVKSFHLKKIKENMIKNKFKSFFEFRGFKKNIEYGSEEYQEILHKKTIYSLKGYKSNKDFFDIVEKDDEKIYLGEN